MPRRMSKAFNLCAAAVFLFLGSPTAMGAAEGKVSPEVYKSAFQNPKVPFQARLILTEWKEGESKMEEANLLYSPEHAYRIEFLKFDGTVKRVVYTTANDTFTNNFLTANEIESLLGKNYTFQLKGTETFIGRPVWVIGV